MLLEYKGLWKHTSRHSHFTSSRDMGVRLPSPQGKVLIMKYRHCKFLSSWNEWSSWKRLRQALPILQEIHLFRKSSYCWAWVVKGRHNSPSSTVEWQGRLRDFKRSSGSMPHLQIPSLMGLKPLLRRSPMTNECSIISSRR